MKLIKGGRVFIDGNFIKKDVWIANQRILAVVEPNERVSAQLLASLQESLIPFEVLECKGKYVVPGFIDGHVHICGGGGEGGFKTRTRELEVTEMVSTGVTTVVGCLGTDGVSRSMEGLVAKMHGLKEEGVSAYCYTGSYRLPLKTLTGDIMKDLMMIEGIIGIGEIAISDHRSAHAGNQIFAQAVSDARVAGKLSGKCGVCNVHLGDGVAGLQPILDVLEQTEIPITQFLPTHMNRNPEIFEAGIAYALKGGYVDFTTSSTPQFIEEGEISAAQAIAGMLSAGVPIAQITLTSDGQGSLPAFDARGNLEGLTVGKMDTLYASVKEAHTRYNVPFEAALKTITENPATILKLTQKGKIQAGLDGDLVILDGDFEIDGVLALGQLAVWNKMLLWSPTFSENN